MWVQLIEFVVVMFFIRAVRESWKRIAFVVSNSIAIIACLFAYLIFSSMLFFFLFKDERFDDEAGSFDTLPDAIFNVYILLTDSNFPDMLFPYWRVTNTAAIFYVAYLCIGMFMLLNLLLAVFFNNYKQIIEMKIRKFDDSRLEFLAKEFAKCRE